MDFILECVRQKMPEAEIASTLVNKAIQSGSNDNVTAMVVNLKELYSQYM